MSEQTDVIKHRIVYDAHASDLITALDMALHEISQLAHEDVAAIADVAHFNLHSLSERLVNNELAHERAMAEGGWQDIASAPTNQAILIFIPNAEHYGPGIYRAILVDMGTGRRWHTTGFAVGRDLTGDVAPTYWMHTPAPPTPTTKEETA